MQRAQGSSFHKLPTMLCQLSMIQLPCVIPALVSDPSPIFLFKTLANSLLNQVGLWWYHDFSLLFSSLGLCVMSPQEKHHTLSVHKTSLDQLLGCHLVFPLASFWFFSWVANPEWQGPILSLFHILSLASVQYSYTVYKYLLKEWMHKWHGGT